MTYDPTSEGHWAAHHNFAPGAVEPGEIRLSLAHHPGPPHFRRAAPELEVVFFHGAEDGKPVIQIDGSMDFRINVNDGTIWDQSPEAARQPFPDVEDASNVEAFWQLCERAALLAEGGSTDDELETLNEALELAQHLLPRPTETSEQDAAA